MKEVLKCDKCGKDYFSDSSCRWCRQVEQKQRIRNTHYADLSEDDINNITKVFEDECCNFCRFSDECPKGATCYGDSPIFPACAECDVPYWIDEEEYDDYIDELKEEEVNE